mmetsp:Transcript_33926/g.99732  ORF Transcript_33926/g.99732 Transcript_33926/m.99732 type:complete len:367 (-) Transcript_33926:15-1115(-)
MLDEPRDLLPRRIGPRPLVAAHEGVPRVVVLLEEPQVRARVGRLRGAQLGVGRQRDDRGDPQERLHEVLDAQLLEAAHVALGRLRQAPHARPDEDELRLEGGELARRDEAHLVEQRHEVCVRHELGGDLLRATHDRHPGRGARRVRVEERHDRLLVLGEHRVDRLRVTVARAKKVGVLPRVRRQPVRHRRAELIDGRAGVGRLAEVEPAQHGDAHEDVDELLPVEVGLLDDGARVRVVDAHLLEDNLKQSRGAPLVADAEVAQKGEVALERDREDLERAVAPLLGVQQRVVVKRVVDDRVVAPQRLLHFGHLRSHERLRRVLVRVVAEQSRLVAKDEVLEPVRCERLRPVRVVHAPHALLGLKVVP